MKSGQGLARPSRRSDERVVPSANVRPPVTLRRRRLAELVGKPLADGRVKRRQNHGDTRWSLHLEDQRINVGPRTNSVSLTNNVLPFKITLASHSA
jgi:hypothetical protein